MKRIINKLLGKKSANKKSNSDLVKQFIDNGKIPWSKGYWPYKMEKISNLINSDEKLQMFTNQKIDEGFGIGIDERLIEYGWFFSKLKDGKYKLLDAGSTLNFPEFVNNKKIMDKVLFIQTLEPEKLFYNEKGISYIYDDLRDIPIREDFFDVVMSISTIEHIDMDNEVFGVQNNNNKSVIAKQFGYLKACSEMARVTKNGGDFFLTFPFGIWKNYGFFQQLDAEMVDLLLNELKDTMTVIEESYFKYEPTGWRYAKREELKESLTYNPHTGEDKGDDGAAHGRGICCIHFKKIV